MKNVFLITIISFLMNACAIENKELKNDTIKLPVSFVQGYGSFDTGFGMLNSRPMSEDNPWIKTKLSPDNVPLDWEDVVVQQLWFDAKQFAYQNYKQGNLTEEFFNQLIDTWHIDLDNAEFSETPIKCFVQIVSGKNKDGEIVYKIDFNHNNDFGDDITMHPVELKNYSQLDSLSQYASLINYELVHNQQIIQRTAPLLIVLNQRNSLMWNMPQYAVTEYKGVEFNISDFFSVTFDYPSMKIKRDSVFEKDSYSKNQFIKIEEDVFQFKAFDYKEHLLVLTKMPADTILYSAQIGFNAVPFEGEEFSTKEKLSLDNYKGKYLFLEFWGSWCGPCIQDLPNLKKAFAEVDRDKMDFLGIAEDSAEPLRNAIDKYEIAWNQILSDNENMIVSNYGIDGFPSSFLIDPDGMIVARNLRGKNLADTLRYYLGRE